MTAMAPRQLGFSYIGLLILVAIMGIMMAATADVWQTTRQREKEEELLYVGDQFRLAIQHFYQQAPGRARRYPTSFDELLLDPRYPEPRRYLRRVYPDPITGSTDWGLVKGPNGELYGVYSKSEAEPIKKANFRTADSGFEGRSKYSEWQFAYMLGPIAPVVVQAQPAPLKPPATPILGKH